MFAYCNNVPILSSDPTGHEMDWWQDEYGYPVADGTAALVMPYGYGTYIGDVGYSTSMTPATTSTYSCVARAIAAATAIATLANSVATAAYPQKEDNKKKSISYWEAARVGSQVIVGKPLTYSEALLRVSQTGSIMCKDQYAAFAIIVGGHYWKAVGPERTNKEGYYWHYHPTRNHTGYESIHIWFYGEAITNGYLKRR